MCLEAYRDLTHKEACGFVAGVAIRNQAEAWHEWRLPNNRIADVLLLTDDGNIEIVEVKTEWRDSLLQEAYAKYWNFCHRLWFAVVNLDRVPVSDLGWPARWPEPLDRVGIIGIHREGLRFLRAATPHTMTHNAQSQVMQSCARNSQAER